MKTNALLMVMAAAMSLTPLINADVTRTNTSNSGSSSSDPAASSSQKEVRTNGRIESVNAPASEIVVITAAGSRTRHSLAPTTVISDGSSALAIGDLKPGDTVTVTQNTRGEVTEVSVAPTGTKKQ